MKMKTKYKLVLAGLLVSSVALAGHTNNPSRNWEELREKNLSCGLAAKRIDQALTACRKSGLTVEQTDALLCPVYSAQTEALPGSCVFLKIEEGLAKQVPADQVRSAAVTRLECLRRADQLVMAVRQGRGGQHNHLVMHTCMALESGLPETVLQNVFSRPGGFRYGRLIHVIEAGEALQLAGLAPKDTQHIMNDCLDRDLNGSEVMRVVELFQQGLQAGKDFDTLHNALWVAPKVDCSER